MLFEPYEFRLHTIDIQIQPGEEIGVLAGQPAAQVKQAGEFAFERIGEEFALQGALVVG